MASNHVLVPVINEHHWFALRDGHRVQYSLCLSGLNSVSEWEFNKTYSTLCEAAPTKWNFHMAFKRISEKIYSCEAVLLKVATECKNANATFRIRLSGDEEDSRPAFVQEFLSVSEGNEAIVPHQDKKTVKIPQILPTEHAHVLNGDLFLF
ncbi:unnamed protein product [Larinioides sclopetarius]|uniref:Ubiquitinyl hydrolase 1 n=1 Tax=Larinioides sclopetarius TaxID=280406 RepID=A0AAV1ZFJ2_9ARAC